MLSKILDFKFQIIGALAIFSGIAAGYYTCKIRKSSNKSNLKFQKKLYIGYQNTFETLNSSKCYSEAHHKQAQKRSSLYSQFYFDKELEIQKVLDHLEIEGVSIETIYKYSPFLAVNEYKEFTKEIRNRRRLIRTINQDQYIKLIIDYEHEVDELLERSREEIVYQCEIDPDEFQSMKVIYEATEDLTALVRNSLKELKNIGHQRKRLISRCQLQKIINQEVSFIRSKLYERLQQKLENEFDQSQDEVFKVIYAMIDDIIFEKYGYEREEIELAIENQWQVELSKEIKQLKKARSEFQSIIGNITLFSSDSDADDNIQKSPSQGPTKSGGNTTILEDEELKFFSSIKQED